MPLTPHVMQKKSSKCHQMTYKGLVYITMTLKEFAQTSDRYESDLSTDSGTSKVVRASPRVCQNLLGKFCVLPTSKKLCKVKKEFISNSLA
jgi:hypothetical protein